MIEYEYGELIEATGHDDRIVVFGFVDEGAFREATEDICDPEDLGPIQLGMAYWLPCGDSEIELAISDTQTGDSFPVTYAEYL